LWVLARGADATRTAAGQLRLLLDGSAQPHQLLLGLFGANTVGRVLQETLVGRDGVRGLAPQLLHTRQRKLNVVEEEVLWAEIAGHRLERVDGLGPVALGLPGVADGRAGQRAHRGTAAARERDLVGAAGRAPVARGVAQIAELVARLRHRRCGRMLREQLLELLLRAGARVGRGLRALRRVHARHDLGVDGGDATLTRIVPVPAAGSGGQDDHRDDPAQDQGAGRRQRHVHPGTSAGRGVASGRSSQSSLLTLAPSAAAKLLLLTVPVSAPVGKISTRVSADRLPRTTPPTTIARAVMLASTRPSAPTCTVPSRTMSPSNSPSTVSGPSPRISPFSFIPTPIVVGESWGARRPWPPKMPRSRPKNASRRLIAIVVPSGIAGRSAGSVSSPHTRGA